MQVLQRASGLVILREAAEPMYSRAYCVIMILGTRTMLYSILGCASFFSWVYSPPTWLDICEWTYGFGRPVNLRRWRLATIGSSRVVWVYVAFLLTCAYSILRLPRQWFHSIFFLAWGGGSHCAYLVGISIRTHAIDLSHLAIGDKHPRAEVDARNNRRSIRTCTWRQVSVGTCLEYARE